MAIRLRTVDGVLIAVCAVETDPEPGDEYLDDVAHEALADKFAHDWGLPGCAAALRRPLMERVRVRDAEESFTDA